MSKHDQRVPVPKPPRGETSEPKDPRVEEYEKRGKKLWDVFGLAIRGGSQNLVVDGRPRDPYFSGDAASLFTLARAGEGDEARLEPYKLAWGEFSANTFEDELPDASPNDNTRAIRETLRSFRGPLFVVPQDEGYFDLQDPKKYAAFLADPERYLVTHATLIYENGQLVQKRTLSDRDASSQSPQLAPARSFTAVMTEMRNIAIDTRQTPEAFARSLSQLPDEPEKMAEFLGAYQRVELMRQSDLVNASPEVQAQQEMRRTIFLLRSMGISESHSVCWGNRNAAAMHDISQLKQQFDFNTNHFRPFPN